MSRSVGKRMLPPGKASKHAKTEWLSFATLLNTKQNLQVTLEI